MGKSLSLKPQIAAYRNALVSAGPLVVGRRRPALAWRRISLLFPSLARPQWLDFDPRLTR
jgi:hypothetical protein